MCLKITYRHYPRISKGIFRVKKVERTKDKSGIDRNYVRLTSSHRSPRSSINHPNFNFRKIPLDCTAPAHRPFRTLINRLFIAAVNSEGFSKLLCTDEKIISGTRHEQEEYSSLSFIVTYRCISETNPIDSTYCELRNKYVIAINLLVIKIRYKFCRKIRKSDIYNIILLSTLWNRSDSDQFV